ncbi:MAG TPA: hypothetical protein VI456_11095 [Polyangia bacterium]
MNIRRLTSLGGTMALLLIFVGCGGGGGDGTGGVTGGGGTGATGATGGNGGIGGANQTSDYSFAVTPTALSLPLGGTQDVTITIDRDTAATTFTDSIMFTLELPSSITGSGVTQIITPNPATAGSTTLTVNVGTTGIVAGSYTLDVVGAAGAQTYTVPLTLTVTGAKNTLLVDNDGTSNNEDPSDTTDSQSTSDTLFATLLQGEGLGFNTFVCDETVAGTGADPTAATIANYTTIVWYTGSLYGAHQTMSPAQEAILSSWLDAGGHTLLIFSQDLMYDNGIGDWITPETDATDAFLADYIGAAGDADDHDLDEVSYTATGLATTAFAGESFHVVRDAAIATTADVVNPARGTDALVTVTENPDEALTAPTAVPAAVGRKHVGAKGTSTVVYVGIPLEDVLMTTGNNSPADFFHATLVYAGIDSN